MGVFPTEIIHEILHNYKPYTASPVIGEDAAWRNSNRGPSFQTGGPRKYTNLRTKKSTSNSTRIYSH
jgi:hypothetical protein